jgi:hypothetical protein
VPGVDRHLPGGPKSTSSEKCHDGQMTFFDDVPLPPEPPEPSFPERKAWMGPPDGWAGGWVPWHVVLFKTANLHCSLSGGEAYPTGASFSLILRSQPDPDDAGPFDRILSFVLGGAEGPRLGIGFADGRKAVMGGLPRSEEGPEGPVLMPGGGGGGGDTLHTSLWLSPLPPPGPLDVVVSWETQNIAEQKFEFDGAELVAAAERAEKLWDYDRYEVARRHRNLFGGAGWSSAGFSPVEQPLERGKGQED